MLVVPAIAIPDEPASEMIIGASRVVPQVGQPEPRMINPVTMPAFWMLAEFLRYLYTKTTKLIRVAWIKVRTKIYKKS